MERQEGREPAQGIGRRPVRTTQGAQGSKTRVPAGRVLDRRPRRCAVRGRSRRCTSRSYSSHGGRERRPEINLEGYANVSRPRSRRGSGGSSTTSSVAAYGFPRDNPLPLPKEVPARGHTTAHPLTARPRERSKTCSARSVEGSETTRSLPAVAKSRAPRSRCSSIDHHYVTKLSGALTRRRARAVPTMVRSSSLSCPTPASSSSGWGTRRQSRRAAAPP